MDSLLWMQRYTKTQDEKNLADPYRPFPKYDYFQVLHDLWINEPIVLLEKSRTMMATWWGAAECLHYVMTHQPADCIFWAPDEERSLKPMKYCKTLYRLQVQELKDAFPLSKDLDAQSYDRLEFAGGGLLKSIPGKDPNRLRSEHPTIIMVDEAALIDKGGEAFDIAQASKPQKMLCITTAYPGWFRTFTQAAVIDQDFLMDGV